MTSRCAAAVVVLALTGELPSQDAGRGQLVSIGTHRLHLRCTGEAGGPTVILEAGAGASSNGWATVQSRVSAFARVCSYDRAGMGASDRGPDNNYSGERVVDELARLLRSAGERSPLILVGHSFGGIYVRLFAHRYPDLVAGMVLVDSSHEDQFMVVGRMGAATAHLVKPRDYENDAAWKLLFASAGPAGPRPDSELSLPPDFFYRDNARKDMAQLFRARRRASQPLGSKPLVVITAGMVAGDDDPKLSPEQRRLLRDSRLPLQADLVRLSRNGKQITASESGHDVHKEQPDLVAEAIRDVVGQLDARRLR